ncbi:hypothetical protein A3735_11140 [Oleiphilus sp. HI0061]|nr:hypothetical protein A3735_11140 [Oleiphilus sp. HI0061]
MLMGNNKDRLRHLIKVAEKEAKHLELTWSRLKSEEVNPQWVAGLEDDLDMAERVDAFVARFGRLQDHLDDKCTPELLKQMLETPSSAINNLGRMEKLGLIASVEQWIEARNLRNRLVHDYVDDHEEFASALNRAIGLVDVLLAVQKSYNKQAQSLLAL